MAGTRSAVSDLPRVKRRSQPVNAVDTYFEGPPPSQQESRSARIVKGLAEFTGAAREYAATEEKKKIEMDKVTQQQRAIRGLDPTDDATKAGMRAYQVVNMRDDVLEANADLAERIRSNPDMTDEEYEITTRQVYDGLYTKYQGDPQLTQALSNKLQESQVQTHQIRAAAQRKNQAFQRENAFKTSIESYREASSSPEELASMMQEGGQLYNEAEALGITEPERRTMLVNFAEMDARNGDGRVLKAIEGQEWASRDPRVQKARETQQSWEARENAVEIGSQWGSIQDSWKTRRASWEQTQAAIQQLNDRYPGAVSANQVASLKQQAAARHTEDTRNAAAFAEFYRNIGSDDQVRLGDDALMPEGQKGFIVGKTAELIEDRARQYQSSGEMTSAEANSWVLEQKLRFGREQSVEMPGIQPIISSLAATDPSDWAGEGVPNDMQPALRTIAMMNESDIERYGKTETEKTMMRTYRRFLSSEEPDRDAWSRAYRAVTTDSSMDPSQRATLIEEANSNVEDAIDRNLLEWFAGKEDVPETLSSYLKSNARSESLAVMGSGGTDAEMASNVGAQRAMDKVTLLDSGSYVTMNKNQIIRSSAYRDENGNVNRLTERDISPAFQTYFENNKSDMQLESFHGEDLSIKNVRFEVAPSGLINVIDDMGEPLTDGPINLRSITRDYLNQTAQERARRAAENARNEASRTQGGEEFLYQRY